MYVRVCVYTYKDQNNSTNDVCKDIAFVNDSGYDFFEKKEYCKRKVRFYLYPFLLKKTSGMIVI